MTRTVTQRPFTPEEQRFLRQALSDDQFGWKNWLYSQIGIFLFGSFFASAVLPRWTYLTNRQTWLVVAAICGIWFFASIPFFRLLRKKFGERSFARDVRSGMAHVERFQALDAIAFEEWDDLGDAYFIKLADDSVLFLMGQYFYDQEEFAFPSYEFESVRTESGFLLSLRVLGKPLRPSGSIGVFRREVIREGLPADGEILKISWNEILGRYGRQS